MKIFQLIDELKSYATDPVDEARTCDTVKCGDKTREITGVGVAMFATPNVIRRAAELGLNVLIVHEPLCYEHMDSEVPYAIGHEKRRLLDELGITVFRYHDYAHSIRPDLIFEGQLASLGIDGQAEKGRFFGFTRFRLQREMTARELALLMEEKWGLRHVRIVGSADRKGAYLSCGFGAPGNRVGRELEEVDFVLTGEICEWAEGELARDYAQLGVNKAILVLGHVGSEREGMKLLAERLSAAHSQWPTRYLECGELYTYTEESRIKKTGL